MPITLDGSAGISGATTGTFSGNVTANGLSTELRPLVLDTAKASTSGTTVDFTGIPSWAKRITISFSGVSTSGTSQPLIQLGDSGGIENTGYLGASSVVQGAAVGQTAFTTGFGVEFGNQNTAAAVRHGVFIIALVSGNTWAAMGGMSLSNVAATSSTFGSKTLSATLDRVRVTTVNGTDTFDAGTINIMYE